MSTGIAKVGYHVVLSDISNDTLQKSISTVTIAAKKRVQKGKLSETERAISNTNEYDRHAARNVPRNLTSAKH